MAVSGINNYSNNYSNVMYQWQAQQLKSTGSSTATSNSVANIFGSTTSLSSQLSSMIELTKYSMDAMGLSSDSRVTFSQITKYRSQLQNEFDQGVKQGFANSGISDLQSLSFSLDKDGKLSAIGGTRQDRAKAQSWLDANSSLGAELLNALGPEGIAHSINFHISSLGQITVENDQEKAAQESLSANEDIEEEIRTAYEKLGFNSSAPINLTFDGNGNLVATGDHAIEMNQWLSTNSPLSTKISDELKKLNIDPSQVTLSVNGNGISRVSVNDASLKEIQTALDGAKTTGQKIYNGLNNMKIDASATFSIQITEDGSLNIISDHPDRDKIQRFFDENPELVKKFRQIETLAGIDDARKAMQISPSEMRKRIQIESMASWWSDSGSAASYFGAYDNGLSLLSGLNLSV